MSRTKLERLSLNKRRLVANRELQNGWKTTLTSFCAVKSLKTVNSILAS